MTNKIVVAGCCQHFSDEIVGAVKKVKTDTQIETVSTECELINAIQWVINPTIIVDKFFLSYKIKTKLMHLKDFRPSCRVYFADRGINDLEFGYRLYHCGADGYCEEMENSETLLDFIRNVLLGLECYCSRVKENLDSGSDLDFPCLCNEVSDTEIMIARRKADNMSSKEIAFDLHLKNELSVNTRFSQLKKKTGVKGIKELILLNSRFGLGGSFRGY